MSTSSVPTGTGLKTQAEPIVGRPISADEWDNIPKELRYSFRSVKPSLLQRVVGGIKDALTLNSMKGPGRPYRCPLCESKDPDVTILVINACSLGPAREVAVECVNGHYAYYGCP